MRVKVAEFAVSLAVGAEIEPIERERPADLSLLHVELAGSSFDDPMGPVAEPLRRGAFARHLHRDRNRGTGRPEPSVDHISHVVDAHVGDAMGERRQVVAIVDHPSESNSHVVTELAQHGE